MSTYILAALRNQLLKMFYKPQEEVNEEQLTFSQKTVSIFLVRPEESILAEPDDDTVGLSKPRVFLHVTIRYFMNV